MRAPDTHADLDIPDVFHCHILDHEDLDMIAQSVVIDEGQRMNRWRCPIISE